MLRRLIEEAEEETHLKSYFKCENNVDPQITIQNLKTVSLDVITVKVFHVPPL